MQGFLDSQSTKWNNGHMEKRKRRYSLLFYGSVGLILFATLMAVLLNRLQPTSSSDIRAKAGVLSTLKITGTVTTVNDMDGTIVVSNVQFLDQKQGSKTLGVWTVTPPPKFSLRDISPGVKLTLTIDAKTFLATTHTVTATTITINK